MSPFGGAGGFGASQGGLSACFCASLCRFWRSVHWQLCVARASACQAGFDLLDERLILLPGMSPSWTGWAVMAELVDALA